MQMALAFQKPDCTTGASTLSARSRAEK